MEKRDLVEELELNFGKQINLESTKNNKRQAPLTKEEFGILNNYYINHVNISTSKEQFSPLKKKATSNNNKSSKPFRKLRPRSRTKKGMRSQPSSQH